MKPIKFNSLFCAKQTGIAALEFALVVTLFFGLLFGVVSYGAAFLVQQSLSRAAQEGARAMLQASLAPGQPVAPATMACEAVTNSLQWLNAYRQKMASGPVSCVPGVPAACSYGTNLQCASVVVTYSDYRSYPLIPDLLPLGNWLASAWGNKDGFMPKDLSATATVQMGQGAS
jgi:Flp pilus assembly protein TadG